MKRWIWVAAWVGFTAAILARPLWSQTDWASKLPDGEGKDLTVQLCGSCHDLGRSVNARKDAKGWDQTVSDMVSRGAQIFPDEAEKITKYLATNFGTNSLPQK